MTFKTLSDNSSSGYVHEIKYLQRGVLPFIYHHLIRV